MERLNGSSLGEIARQAHNEASTADVTPYMGQGGVWRAVGERIVEAVRLESRNDEADVILEMSFLVGLMGEIAGRVVEVWESAPRLDDGGAQGHAYPFPFDFQEMPLMLYRWRHGLRRRAQEIRLGGQEDSP